MKRVLFSFAALAALLAFTSTAQAGLQVTVADQHGNSVSYTGTGTGTGPATYSSTGGIQAPSFYDGTPGAQTLSTLGLTTLNVHSDATTGPNSGTGILTFSLTSDMSNSPGTPGHAMLGTDSQATLTYAGPGTATIDVAFSGNGFLTSNFGSFGQITASETLTNNSATGPTITSIDYINPYTPPTVGPDNGGLNMPSGFALPQLTATNTAHGGAASVNLPGSTLGSTGTFALGQVIQVTLATGQSVSFQASTSITPEPATLAAWGCGLGLIGLVRRRRRAAQTA